MCICIFVFYTFFFLFASFASVFFSFFGGGYSLFWLVGVFLLPPYFHLFVFVLFYFICYSEYNFFLSKNKNGVNQIVGKMGMISEELGQGKLLSE
jgi:hypothetical protein